MTEKKLKTRIQQKTDTKANWDKAVNFVPLKGEYIYYSDINRVKVGDGVKKLSELPFLADSDTHQPIKSLNTNNTVAQAVSANEAIAGSGAINLHKVAKTGSYNDLNNKPTIPSFEVIGNGTLTIRSDGLEQASFTDGSSSYNTKYIDIPTKVSDLYNDAGYFKGDVTENDYNTRLINIGYDFEICCTYNYNNKNQVSNYFFDVNGVRRYSNITKKTSYFVMEDKLKTINGNSLVGSGNINITDDTKLPLTGGTISGDVTVNKNMNVGGSLTVGNKAVLTDHQLIKTLKTDNTAAQTPSANESIAGSGTINLHKVAKTGSYNDLNDKPDLSVYVPYTGATKDVNLGEHSLLISDKTDDHGPMIKVSGKGIREDDVYTTIEPCSINMKNPLLSASLSISKLEINGGASHVYVTPDGCKLSYYDNSFSSYEYDGINHNNKKLTFPENSGTIALTRDLGTQATYSYDSSTGTLSITTK